MPNPDAKTIAEKFKNAKQSFQKWGQDSGMEKAVQDLSQMMRGLQEAGLDVSLRMMECPGELSFSMFNHTTWIRVPLAGILRIGSHERLIACAINIDNTPCLQLAVSKFDFRFQGANAKLSGSVQAQGNLNNVHVANRIPADIYDLKNDPDSLIKLENEIIHFTARTAVLEKWDVARSFGEKKRLLKASLQPQP